MSVELYAPRLTPFPRLTEVPMGVMLRHSSLLAGFLMTGTGVPQDERKGLKWIHKATFQGNQPAIDYCKEHGYKWL